MIFDQIGVNKVSLRTNDQQKPYEDILLDYNTNHIARVYHLLLSYMGRDQNVDIGLLISQFDFKNLYMMYYFLLEHLDFTRLSVVDIHFRACATCLAGIAYRAYVVILSDKSMLHESVGRRMRIINAPLENL